MKDSLENKVIKNGFCVGCGICTAVKHSPYKVKFDKYGLYQAYKTGAEKNDPVDIEEVCPFASQKNEEHIAKSVFDTNGLKRHKYIGYYSNLYAGHVNADSYRLSSTSGGLVSWTLEKLIDNNLIDAVIHVKKAKTNTPLFEYVISSGKDELLQGKKSRYYPVELSGILAKIKGDSRRFAIVGIPCFIKGIRLLKEQSNEYDNLKFLIGIICGQLKSTYFSSLFAFQHKINPKDLTDIDFRVKLQGKKASDYAVSLKGGDNNTVVSKPARYLFGSDWGMGMLKYQACDFCDDVFNETSDITFGDAWVSPYNKDWKGTNLVIIRNPVFKKLFERSENNEISIKELSEEDTLKTQEPSIRHRVDSLGYRLYRFEKKKSWIPQKRSKPARNLEKGLEKTQNNRMAISLMSHHAMNISIKLNSFLFFKFLMYPLIKKYDFDRYGFWALVPLKIKKLVKK